MPAAPGPPSAPAAAGGLGGGRCGDTSPRGAAAAPRPPRQHLPLREPPLCCSRDFAKLSHLAGGERLPAKCERGGSHPVRGITPLTSPLLPSQPFSLLPPSSAAFPRKSYQCGHAALRRFACSKHQWVPEEVACGCEISPRRRHGTPTSQGFFWGVCY